MSTDWIEIMKWLMVLAFFVLPCCSSVEKLIEPADPSSPDVQVAEDTVAVLVEDTPTSQSWPGAKSTIAGLGDPARAGLWLETPLVDTQQSGRIVSRASGASVAVTLLPASGPDTAGSRLSLQAMRALNAPLTDLVELEVFSG